MLVIGVPGVGKSTLCRGLVAAYPEHFVAMSLGDAIQAELGSQIGSRLEMRSRGPELISDVILRRAHERIWSEVADRGEFGKLILLEWRDVVTTDGGFRTVPLDPRLANRSDCLAVLNIVISGNDLYRRVYDQPDGRPSFEPEVLERCSRLQSSLALLYCSQLGGFFAELEGSVEPRTVLERAFMLIAPHLRF